MHRSRRRAVPALTGIAAAVLFCVMTAGNVSAQGNSVNLSIGQALYSSDEFCLDSEAFITDYQLGYEGTILGAEASYSRNWPWPPTDPPGGGGGGAGSGQQEDRYLSHGKAFTALVKLFPFGALGGDRQQGLRNFDRILRPFIAAGLHISRDGESAPAGDGRDLPTWGVAGQTAPLLAVGASLHLPARDQRIGVVITYRQNFLFARDFEIDRGALGPATFAGETLEWGVLSAGIRVSL